MSDYMYYGRIVPSKTTSETWVDVLLRSIAIENKLQLAVVIDCALDSGGALVVTVREKSEPEKN